MSIRHNDLEYARKLLMLGKSLTEAAIELGVSTLDLDLALWRRPCRLSNRRAA